MSFGAEDVNILIYRYLAESGYLHTAYAFEHESLLSDSPLLQTNIPPGLLIQHLQKALQYKEIELHINEDGTEKECGNAVKLLELHTCSGSRVEPVKLEELIEIAEEISIPKHFEIKEKTLTLYGYHSDSVFINNWRPNSQIFTTLMSPNKVALFDVQNYTSGNVDFIEYLLPDRMLISVLDWSVNGEYVCIGTKQGVLIVLNDKFELITSTKITTEPIHIVRWGPTHQNIAFGGDKECAGVYSIDKLDFVNFSNEIQRPIADIDWINVDQILVGSKDGSITLLSIGQFTVAQSFQKFECQIYRLIHQPEADTSKFASISDDKTLKIWEVDMTDPLYSLDCHDTILSLAWCQSYSNYIACSTMNGGVFIWDTLVGQLVKSFSYSSSVNSIGWCVSQPILAVCTSTQMELLSLDKDECVFSYMAKDIINNILWDHQNRLISLSLLNGDVDIVDVPLSL